MSMTRRTVPTLFTLALGLLLAGCQSANITEQTAREVNRRGGPVITMSGLPAAPVVGSTDYRVGPLDVLDIEVFGHPDFTRSVRIAVSGEFTLPLVGAIPADGKTVADLQAEVKSRLEEKYLESAQVTVFVREYNSQRVTVEGAVGSPGIKSLTGRTSLLQLFAMSGGIQVDANPAGIIIYRNVEGRRHAAVFDIREVRAGRMVDPEVLGGDMVVVDFSGARTNLKDFFLASPLLAIFMAL
jgi:polysaccharide export outer membrane protein